MRLDARIPVRVVPPGEAGPPSPDVVLVSVGGGGKAAGWAAVRTVTAAPIASHEAGCRCCSGRSELADALGLLFTDRAKAKLSFFREVVLEAPQARFHEVVTILRQDATVAGRFRLAP